MTYTILYRALSQNNVQGVEGALNSGEKLKIKPSNSKSTKTVDGHINSRFKNPDSPFISFSTSPKWIAFYALKQKRYDTGRLARPILIILVHSDRFKYPPPENKFAASASEILIKGPVLLDGSKFKIIDVYRNYDGGTGDKFADFSTETHRPFIEGIIRSTRKLLRSNMSYLQDDAIRFIRFLFIDDSDTTLETGMSSLNI